MDQTVGTWILGIVLVLIQTGLTTALGLVIKRIWDKKEAEKKELEELRERQRVEAEQGRCNIVKETVHQEIKELEQNLTNKSDARYEQLKNVYTGLQEDVNLLKDGLQKDLYVDLCNIYDQYKTRIKNGGFISRGEKTEYDKIYWSYHNLGKNGVADKMHNEVMNMPEEPKGE